MILRFLSHEEFRECNGMSARTSIFWLSGNRQCVFSRITKAAGIKTRLRGLFHKASANWRLSQFVDLCSQVSLMTCSFVLWIRPLAAWRSTIGCISLNAFCAAALSPASIAAYTFLMKVRIIERRLALCLRAFSDWMARFLADLILAKVQLPNVFYMDNSKAEEYALLAFFCQWICANKRR